MKHAIPVAQLGPCGTPMADAVQACVHCGFCLATCPTYRTLGQEMDSPRGRIVLMKEVLEGNLELEQALPYVDRCLGCLACQTACPSGVRYGNLISPFRGYADRRREYSLADRLKRLLLAQILPYPTRFRLAVKFSRLGRRLRFLTPRNLHPMLDLAPSSLPAARPLQGVYPAMGPRRARVALLAGCVQRVLQPEINLATIAVLNRCGVEVLIPPQQACCGALDWHIGGMDRARKLGRRNLAAFPHDIDAVVTNAAGCGSALHEYPLMFRDTPWEEAAQSFSQKAVDVSQFLDQLGLIGSPRLPQATRVGYHDACHLAHAQQVQAAPRRILRAIVNLELVEIRNGQICCGSAGTYNIDHPDVAGDLGRRKASDILAADCRILAAGNIGCMVQIERFLDACDGAPQVRHTMQVLRDAYGEAGEL